MLEYADMVCLNMSSGTFPWNAGQRWHLEGLFGQAIGTPPQIPQSTLAPSPMELRFGERVVLSLWLVSGKTSRKGQPRKTQVEAQGLAAGC